MTVKPRQRWLILSHAFNMDGRAASQTITDKLPHLLAAGIEVVVLSGVLGTQDQRFEHHRLWPVGPAALRFDLRHVLSRRLGKGALYRVLMLLISLVLLPFMVIEKLLRPVENAWSWWLSAYLKGRALARQQPFDLIYSTGGAFAAHMAGRALKRATGTPWLAEVHDPMVVPGTTPRTAHQKMQARIERQICTEADVAIWFTDQALAGARTRHPQLAERGKMMLPGIDKPFKELPPYTPGPKFVIGHLGSLAPTRHLGPIIAALEWLGQRRPDVLAAMELHLYGGPLDGVSAGLLERSPVRERVRHFGRVEADPVTGLSGREQILRRMREFDVLLVLHGEDPLCEEYIPSKLYEYLWMQRPILAVVHRNPQMLAMLQGEGHQAVLTQAESGQVSDAAVGEQLAAKLVELFQRWQTTGLPDSGRPSPYTTQAAVTQLIGWVRQATAQRH
jgi:glycosyltransferase involved in cell wall biosynthesis